MAACPAPTPTVPDLGRLLIERGSLECRLASLTQKLLDADAYLERPDANIVLGCAHRKDVRDRRLGVLECLRAVRLEIGARIGG